MINRSRRSTQRQVPDVLAVLLEQVVGHEHDRHGPSHLRDLLLASDALLQRREGERPIVAERQDLAVEHGAVGQVRCRRHDFREAVGDELFAARPEVDRAAALHQLRADPVPLPFEQPVRGIAERGHVLFER